MMHRTHHRTGFALLELLVALTVIAIGLMGFFSAFYANSAAGESTGLLEQSVVSNRPLPSMSSTGPHSAGNVVSSTWQVISTFAGPPWGSSSSGNSMLLPL